MNQPLYHFIQFILTRPEQPLSFTELSEQMRVSIRMIRNYCAQAREFLGHETFSSLFRLTSSSITYIGKSEQTEKLLTNMYNTNFYDYRLSRAERIQVISLLLLISRTPVTISQLEELLYVSRGTLLKDLEILQKDFSEKKLSFTRNKSRGFLLDCSEETRRNAVFLLLSEIHPLDEFFFSQRYHICLGFINRFLKFDKYNSRIENVLRQAENHFSFQFSDHDFYSLSVYLCVIALRLENGCFAESENFSSASGFSVAIAEFILQSLEPRISEHNSEIQYLADILSEKFSFRMWNQTNQEVEHFQSLTHSFLIALSEVYGEDLTSDNLLSEYLTTHLLGTWHRLSAGEQIQNPLKEQMLSDYMEDFLILKKQLHILEENMGCSINDDEAAYILMHVVSALQKLYRQTHILKVIVACNTGMGTASFLAEHIQKHVSVQILSVTSIHSLTQVLSRQEADFVISTVPLQECHLPWIQVHTIPTKEDILTIQTMAEKITEKLAVCRRQSLPNKKDHPQPVPAIQPDEMLSFSGLLTPKHILLDHPVLNWEEAILAAGEPLLQDKIVTHNYLNAMVESVHENGPYIVFAPGIALAHANPSFGVSDIGITLLRLASPVSFGHPLNDPVHIVAALAMLESASHINVLFHIMNILCNRYVFHELLGAKDEETVLSIIRKYE